MRFGHSLATWRIIRMITLDSLRSREEEDPESQRGGVVRPGPAQTGPALYWGNAEQQDSHQYSLSIAALKSVCRSHTGPSEAARGIKMIL